ncbi:DUF7344 domain-containing protein [Halobaculum magnesiiphilum]|uniref:DUF7344 domain-containing protein n=1 Tax=Halobaculum magnesiiphilum TaxID=1017351 RepID=A0A8T8WI82_9EURY|nr:hypothetical protein [Halobaculum magnesiiphilum]QZP39565.1 hypothetical protein K6T50_18545 [Halobaculum magnesiiphilum]
MNGRLSVPLNLTCFTAQGFDFSRDTPTTNVAMSGTRPLSRLSGDDLLDALYKTLANRERRRILRYLADLPEPIPISQVATEIAALEHGDDSSGISTSQQSDTHVALLHIHLPMLDEVGLVNWDRDSDTVAISHTLEELIVTTSGNVLDVSVSVGKQT